MSYKRVGRRLTVSRGSTVIQISKINVDNYNLAPGDKDVVIEDVIEIDGELYYKYVGRSDRGWHCDSNTLITTKEYWFTIEELEEMYKKEATN